MKIPSDLNRIRGVFNYQFETDVGRIFFPSEVKISLSPRTKRVRHVTYVAGVVCFHRPRLERSSNKVSYQVRALRVYPYSNPAIGALQHCVSTSKTVKYRGVSRRIEYLAVCEPLVVSDLIVVRS